MKIAIADTDILSSFGKVGRVDLLQRLFPKILISAAVHRELMKAEQAGLRNANLGRFTVDRLMSIINRLGSRVEVKVRVRPAED